MEDVKLDIGKLAIWRLASHDTFGGTWLSDYLPNRLGIENNEPDIAQPPTPFVDVAPATAEDAPVAEQSPVMQVYIENATDPSIGGFTIPLPTTTEKLRPWLEAIGIGVSGMEVDILDFRATILGLQDSISEMGEKISLEELNYFAEKIANLDESDRVVLSAVLEAERHCGNVAELINLTGNLDRFHLQPAFSEEQYGEFLLDMVKADTSDVFSKLEQSGYDDERNLAKHILRLEAHVDYAILRIASDRRYRDRNGEKLTDFISIKVRGALAERCVEYLTKGDKLAASGDFETVTVAQADGSNHVGFLIKRRMLL
jgi:hypothetical protein